MNDFILDKRQKVTIALAIYKPNEDWMISLLISLNRQTYSNIELIVCNDCPECAANLTLFNKYITNFPFRVYTNEKNIGSNKTFERLTNLANGKYIAFCDQDDIWEDNKILRLVEKAEETNSVLVFSDVSIINGNNEEIAESITHIRKHHIFLTGEHLAPKLIVKNFVIGCAMLVRSDIAKAAMPFEENMVHDHWLALFSALHGRLEFVPESTVRYRQHTDNQTGILMGVKTKEDYYMLRIKLLLDRVASLGLRLSDDCEFLKALSDVSDWVHARERYFKKPGLRNLFDLIRLQRQNREVTLFEVFIPLIPKTLFHKTIKILRQGGLG